MAEPRILINTRYIKRIIPPNRRDYFTFTSMDRQDIYSAAGLTAFIQEVGFLPLLSSGVYGFSAEEVVSDDCRYVLLPDGGWDWP